jgi:hypothetical protein
MRRVGGSSNSNPYHSQANDSQADRSDVSSQRRMRSSDSRFDAFRSRHAANSELGSVASEYAESSNRSTRPGASTNTSGHTSVSGRDAESVRNTVRSTALTGRLSEAGSNVSEAGGSRSRYSRPSSSSTRSGTTAAPSQFRPALPSVAEALSEAGSTRSTQNAELASLLGRLQMLPEDERERDPAFSELVSVVGSLLAAREQTPSIRRGGGTRASTTGSRQSTIATTPPSVAPSSQASGSRQQARGIHDRPRRLHPFSPVSLSLPPAPEPDRSYAETLEHRIARRRQRRPQLASQIPRPTDS